MDKSSLFALIPMFIFYGAYLSKNLLLRQKGIKANRLAKGEKPSSVRLLEMFLLLVTYGLAIIQCLSLLNILPVLYLFKYQRILGFILAMTGSFFFIMAVIAMKDSWRAGIDSSQNTNLMTDGILRFSRNPAFLGFDLFYIGITLMLPSILMVIIVIVALFVFHLQILEEEKFLTTIFGDDYLTYKQKVRRYF